MSRPAQNTAAINAYSAEELLPLVYDELRILAASKLAHEKPGQTLQTTALVNEAYLRLIAVEPAVHWDNRGHFFAAAAEAMRRILVERARAKGRIKRGGDRQRVDLPEIDSVAAERLDVIRVNEALDRLAEVDPQAAELVKLRFFVGLRQGDAAAALGVSGRTANRIWAYAKAWMRTELSGE